jgi:hypothetical protein
MAEWNSQMLRQLALSLLLVPCLGVPQNPAPSKDRVKALDAAAATPFYTKKGADALKRVVAGAEERKQDEKVTDPLDGKTTVVPGAKPPPGGTVPTGTAAPGQAQPVTQPAPPAPDPVFAWRLVGISYGSHQGMALFQTDGKSVSAHNGASLDPETKVVSVSRTRVVLVFHGKRLELTPW